MTPDADLAVVGSGFGGSLLAMIGRRLGMSVVLLERGTHPRFAIGESASPLAGAVLEQLAARYDLPRVAPLAAYGPWTRHYPGIGCGLKRGFTYFKHRDGEPYAVAPRRANQLLVAASPNDWVSDTHWLRADVDHFLVSEAVALGVEYVDRAAIEAIDMASDDAVVIRGRRDGRPLRVRARRIVDATGPRGVLSRILGVEPATFAGYPATQALYSHFTGVSRCADMREYAMEEEPPYPIDAAALHHVFDGGWMWVLRFDNGVTSAGIAVADALAQELRLADGEPAWRRFLSRYPSIAAQFAGAAAIREFTWMPQVAWRSSCAAGDRWAMLPSAAAFVDPLFSTGIPMTLLGIERLARSFESGGFAFEATDKGAHHDGGRRALPSRAVHDDGNGAAAPVGRAAGLRGDLLDYQRATLGEADHTARFIAGCYAAFPRFEQFAAYSMLYFAAAGFSEMSRRLDRPSPGFLFAADGAFAQAVADLSPACTPHDEGYHDRVAAAVARINVAGLCDRSKRNWYGVDLEDAVRGAAKLGVDAGVVRAMALAGQSGAA